MRIWLSSVVSLAFVLFTGCGPADHGGGDSPGADGGGAGSCPTEGATVCDGNSFQTCTDGEWQVTEQCPILCNNSAGCVECQPGANYCDGEDVHSCDADGNAGGVIETCDGGLHCSLGSCVDLCEEAVTNRSYVGCEYWPVDLDNALEVHGLPVFGLAIGLTLCEVVDRYNYKLDPKVYLIDQLPISVSPKEVAVVAAITMLISGFATLFPASKASSLTPVEGLRYD